MARLGDFSKEVKRTLAKRVNETCSNPDCQQPTAGPHSDPARAISNGEAAHIYSAQSKGPRPNPKMTTKQFSSIENGLWLCRNCHAVADADESEYTVEQLQSWKQIAENNAKQNQIKPKNRITTTQSNQEIRQLWAHETTNDRDYVPRREILNKLNSWAEDLSIKVIAITGIGGQGKTSLVGHWLQSEMDTIGRKFEGLFYWSFYSEQDTSKFFSQLLEFSQGESGIKNLLPTQEPLELLRKILADKPFCIVLDGLEVIQEELCKRNKGQFVNSDLRNFLADICLSGNHSLAILTSRFEIVDLKQFSKAVKNLSLKNLTNDEARILLEVV